MKVLQKTSKVNRIDYFEMHLHIINAFFTPKLTSKEIKVLAAFMLIRKEIGSDDVFNTVARREVCERLELSPGGLSNYIKALLSKGFIEKSVQTSRIVMKPFILPEMDSQYYQFKLIYKEDEAEEE